VSVIKYNLFHPMNRKDTTPSKAGKKVKVSRDAPGNQTFGDPG
jgi:hypothetical protein